MTPARAPPPEPQGVKLPLLRAPPAAVSGCPAASPRSHPKAPAQGASEATQPTNLTPQGTGCFSGSPTPPRLPNPALAAPSHKLLHNPVHASRCCHPAVCASWLLLLQRAVAWRPPPRAARQHAATSQAAAAIQRSTDMPCMCCPFRPPLPWLSTCPRPVPTSTSRPAACRRVGCTPELGRSPGPGRGRSRYSPGVQGIGVRGGNSKSVVLPASESVRVYVRTGSSTVRMYVVVGE